MTCVFDIDASRLRPYPPTPGKQAVRVVVLSPWGPLWGDPSPRDLMRLLHGLRAAVAGTTGGVVVTLPTYQLPTGVATRALHTAHCCMRMEAFKGPCCA